MFELEVLVLEFVSVDGLSSGAVVPGEVTTLAHELRDHAVEGAALVAEHFSPVQRALKFSAVLGTTSARRVINAARAGAIGGHVKVNDGVRHSCSISCCLVEDDVCMYRVTVVVRCQKMKIQRDCHEIISMTLCRKIDDRKHGGCL